MSFATAHGDHLDPDKHIPDDYPDDDKITTSPLRPLDEEPDVPCEKCMHWADKIVVLDADDIVCTRTDVDETQGRFFRSHADVCKALHVTGQESCVHIYPLHDFVHGFNEDTVNTTNSFIVHIKMEV